MGENKRPATIDGTYFRELHEGFEAELFGGDVRAAMLGLLTLAAFGIGLLTALPYDAYGADVGSCAWLTMGPLVWMIGMFPIFRYNEGHTLRVVGGELQIQRQKWRTDATTLPLAGVQTELVQEKDGQASTGRYSLRLTTADGTEWLLFAPMWSHPDLLRLQDWLAWAGQQPIPESIAAPESLQQLRSME